MHKTLRSIAASSLISLFVVGASSSAIAADWDVDSSHSRVGFGVRHMMISTIHGTFLKYSGTITIDDKDPAKVSAHIVIDATSIDTGDTKRTSTSKGQTFSTSPIFRKSPSTQPRPKSAAPTASVSPATSPSRTPASRWCSPSPASPPR